MPKRVLRPVATKAATVQMTTAKTSLLVSLPPVPKTNLISIAYYSGFNAKTNQYGYVQSTSDIGKLPFTNVIRFLMNNAQLTNTFSCTNKSRFFRLSW